MPDPFSSPANPGGERPSPPEFKVAPCVPTAKAFLDVVQKSRLVPRRVLEGLRREYSASNRPDPVKLAISLVASGHVTQWQAQQLLAGHSQFYLGRYKLLERIGRGGMGVVFKAQHQVMDRVVALKVIHKERLTNPKSIPRFLKEIKAIAALEHPHIVRAFDADRVGGNYFLAMEYVAGQNLTALVKQRGPLNVKWACELCRQTALGLQHAHERGLVHRDIKPSNLLVVRESPAGPPTVKILDFGLSLLVSDAHKPSDSASSDEIVGTLGFLSPEEVLHPSKVDIRSDVFSLGCTLFFLLTGNTAISGQSDQEQLRRLVTGEHLSVRSFVADIPPGVEQVLTKMLARRPEDRYQTPQEVADALWPFSASTMKDFATARFPVPIPAAIAAQLTPPTNLQAAVDTSMNEFVDRLSNQPLNSAGSTTAIAAPETPAVPAETDRTDEPTTTAKSVRRRRWRLPIVVIAVLCGLVIAAVLWKTLRPGPVRKAGVNRPTINGPALSAYLTDSCQSRPKLNGSFQPTRLRHSEETDVTTAGYMG